MSDRMQTAVVRQVITHAPDLKSFLFREDDITWGGPLTPGVFVLLWLPGVDEKPFSISQRQGGMVEITIKAVGPFTWAMMDVTSGTRLGLRGPFGRGFQAKGPAVVVGGGCGVAPVRYLAAHMRDLGIEHTLILGTRTASELMFHDEYVASDAVLVTEDGSIAERESCVVGSAMKGLVTQPLADALETGRYAHVFASGPEPMLLAVRDLAEQFGVAYQLSFERYMKCGVGICGHCAMDGSGIRMCVEGPVLGREQLEGVTDLGQPHRDATGARPAR